MTHKRVSDAELVEVKLRERAGFKQEAGHNDDADLDIEAANLIHSLRSAREAAMDDDGDRMRKISEVITDLQNIQDQFGDTCVYVRRGGMSWGAVALNRRDDDKKNGVFDLQAQHDRDMAACAQRVQRLISDNRDLRAQLASPAPVTVDEGMSAAGIDVLAERRRQVETEGWTPEHDDSHDHGEMARAAMCYAYGAPEYRKLGGGIRKPGSLPTGFVWKIWPWAPEWWKPTDARRNLVKAGALIIAEIERLDRIAALSKGGAE